MRNKKAVLKNKRGSRESESAILDNKRTILEDERAILGIKGHFWKVKGHNDLRTRILATSLRIPSLERSFLDLSSQYDI